MSFWKKWTEIPEMTPVAIRNDFGNGFVFAGFYNGGDMQEYWQRLEKGNRENLPEKVLGCSVAVFTGGDFPKVVRLSKAIPTFDSGDREYDSWHDLLLACKADGSVEGLYCTGGYRLAKTLGFRKLLKCPEEVRALLVL